VVVVAVLAGQLSLEVAVLVVAGQEEMIVRRDQMQPMDWAVVAVGVILV